MGASPARRDSNVLLIVGIILGLLIPIGGLFVLAEARRLQAAGSKTATQAGGGGGGPMLTSYRASQSASMRSTASRTE